MSERECDVLIAGAGAAGLMAAIFAARGGARVIAVDGATKIGAKILISGGGRCNITHQAVRADDFNGSRNTIAKVLRTFDVEATVTFFESIGVPLVEEETGKLFPAGNRARTVVDALVRAAVDGGVEIVTAARVLKIDTSSERGPERFQITTARGLVNAQSLVLATGGRSVPKTGSDGFGYELARSLGHTITKTFPALVPLVLERGHWLTSLSGTSVNAELQVRSPSGAILHRDRGALLFTHFGLSGPLVLDVSRHWLASHPAKLILNLLPDESFESLDASLIDGGRRNPHATVASILRRRLPERLAELIGTEPLGRLTKEGRRLVVRRLLEMPLPVVSDRGFDYAEVTAGGVPLEEVDVRTMGSRRTAGLFLCGEILDVDGRIGGFNFQWAWASGRLAGIAAAAQ